MRKIIAVLLAVLMLASVLAMIPASAAETFDGSTATTAAKPGLIITEVAQRSHEADGLKKGASTAAERAKFIDAAGFIEVFNNTTGSVDFSTLSLLRTLNFMDEFADPDDPMAKYNWNWQLEKEFLQKMDIVAGPIISAARNEEVEDLFDEESAKDIAIFNSLQNSAEDLTVESGETAVIWFVNTAAVEWMKDKFSGSFNPRKMFVERYYGSTANVADYNIIMVWADRNEMLDDDTVLDAGMFTWDYPADTDLNKSVIIALADNTWDLANDNCLTVNDKLKSMVTLGHLVSGYIAATENNAAVFAPASTKPFYQNRLNEVIGNTAQYNDYVAAGRANSYLEVGAVLWGTKQTPGQIVDWQYAMMADALNVALPTGLDVTAVLNAFYTAEKLGDVEAGHEEEKKDHNYVDREELENLFSGANNDEKKDFPLVLVICIAAGVLVLAAAAVVIFVVILPKKKKAAAAAAAEEAPAEEAVEAPAEEAPVEETPAEEKTEE